MKHALRYWLLFLAGFVPVFAAFLVFALSRPKLYEAEARVADVHFTNVTDPSAPKFLDSIYEKVAERARFASINGGAAANDTPPTNRPVSSLVIRENISSIAYPETQQVGFRYLDADPAWAKKVINVWAEECVVNDVRIHIEKTMARMTPLATEVNNQQTQLALLVSELNNLNTVDAAPNSSRGTFAEDRKRKLEISIVERQASLAKAKQAIEKLQQEEWNSPYSQSARLVDEAGITRAIIPDLWRNIAIGFFLSLAVGFCALFAFRKR